jgi:hypothetical protein
MTPSTLARPAALALTAALLLGTPASANDAPCLAESDKVCPGIPAGDGRLFNCLLRNEFKLSSECVQNLREVQRRANEFSADCQADVFRFCQGVTARGGRVLECLRPYLGRRELASNCEDAVATALEKYQEFVDACRDDAAALCQGVQPGGGRLFLCLRYQAEKLSGRCRKAVNP